MGAVTSPGCVRCAMARRGNGVAHRRHPGWADHRPIPAAMESSHLSMATYDLRAGEVSFLLNPGPPTHGRGDAHDHVSWNRSSPACSRRVGRARRRPEARAPGGCPTRAATLDLDASPPTHIHQADPRPAAELHAVARGAATGLFAIRNTATGLLASAHDAPVDASPHPLRSWLPAIHHAGPEAELHAADGDAAWLSGTHCAARLHDSLSDSPPDLHSANGHPPDLHSAYRDPPDLSGPRRRNPKRNRRRTHGGRRNRR